MNIEARELAEILYSQKNDENDIQILVPLTIDGIECDGRITIAYKGHSNLQVDTRHIQTDEDYNPYLNIGHFYISTSSELTIDRIENELIAFMDVLKTWRFDKISSHFWTEKYIKEKNAVRKLFGNFYRDNKSLEKCYICLDEVKSRTKCGHAICLVCYDKTLDEEYKKDNEHFHCGICRAILDAQDFRKK